MVFAFGYRNDTVPRTQNRIIICRVHADYMPRAALEILIYVAQRIEAKREIRTTFQSDIHDIVG